jgi:hypothetical protein
MRLLTDLMSCFSWHPKRSRGLNVVSNGKSVYRRACRELCVRDRSGNRRHHRTCVVGRRLRDKPTVPGRWRNGYQARDWIAVSAIV